MFSHDESSEGYSACDTKYGDISENSGFSVPTAPSNKAPYVSIVSQIKSVNIENKIKPKSMSCWFTNIVSLTAIDLSNVNTSQCNSTSLMFMGCRNLTSANYGSDFVKPENVSDMFIYSSVLTNNQLANSYRNGNIPRVNRPSWYDLDKFGEVDRTLSGATSTFSIDVENYNYVTYDNITWGATTTPILYDKDGNSLGNLSGTTIPSNAKTLKIFGHNPSSTTLGYYLHK